MLCKGVVDKLSPRSNAHRSDLVNRTVMVIILQYINTSNQQVVHLKRTHVKCHLYLNEAGEKKELLRDFPFLLLCSTSNTFNTLPNPIKLSNVNSTYHIHQATP